jgi:hypothetical protein
MKFSLPTLILLLAITNMACKQVDTAPKSVKEKTLTDQQDAINLQHFNHLYQEITIAGDTMAIVHIYSEAPDYVYAIEPREGYTCVDDVARAILMLSDYHKIADDQPAILLQIKRMVHFVLHMQNENGYFNNFMWNDLTINTSYQTTVAELNWWSLRALWALETALPLLKEDAEVADRIRAASSKLAANLITDLGNKAMTTVTVNTIICPGWLPQQYAADQAAVLVMALLPYQKRTGDAEAKNLIDAMAEGIMLMQKGDATHFPYGAFLSWQNSWHAWGNNQAYALLRAGQQFDNKDYINSALKEVDHFYPYLLRNGFVADFTIVKKGDDYMETQRNEFSQIAYGIRPMVWASVEAYRITNDQKYKDLSNELKSWFFANNVAEATMYDARTGRGYDGILSNKLINRNAGAESSLESLMTMLRTE